MVVAYSGHRPNKLGGYDETNPCAQWVKTQIARSLEVLAPEAVIAGGALGVDTWAAEAALAAGIPLTIAIPFVGFDARWPQASRDRLAEHMKAATRVVAVCLASAGLAAFQRCNEWMVDHCHLLIAFWDGSSGGTANCVRYAQRARRDIRRVNPENFK